MIIHKITTIDNPYDPLSDFSKWQAYDHWKGYNTAEYLARVCHVSNNVSYSMMEQSIEDSIDSIIEMNLLPNDNAVEALEKAGETHFYKKLEYDLMD